jgi:hypothetical protein
LRIFKSKEFARFARKNAIHDAALCRAVRELQSGLVHANLGGGVYKQRIARAGEGKSGGYRSIVFFRAGERTFFIYGFAKNDRDSLSPNELAGLREVAKEVLNYDDTQIHTAVSAGTFLEIRCEESVQERRPEGRSRIGA